MKREDYIIHTLHLLVNLYPSQILNSELISNKPFSEDG